jgi:hypothetical protein
MEDKFLALIYETDNIRREIIIWADDFEIAQARLEEFLDYRYTKDEINGYELIDLSLIEEM